MGQKRLEVFGVEALGVKAVAEGVGVARLRAAPWGGRVILAGTNGERIGGHRGQGLRRVESGGGMEHLIQLWGIVPGIVKGAQEGRQDDCLNCDSWD